MIGLSMVILATLLTQLLLERKINPRRNILDNVARMTRKEFASSARYLTRSLRDLKSVVVSFIIFFIVVAAIFSALVSAIRHFFGL